MEKVGHDQGYSTTQYLKRSVQRKVEKKKRTDTTYLESNLLPLENSVPVCVRDV